MPRIDELRTALHALRLRLGRTQYELSRNLGIGSGTIARIETGLRGCGMRVLYRYLDHLSLRLVAVPVHARVQIEVAGREPRRVEPGEEFVVVDELMPRVGPRGS